MGIDDVCNIPGLADAVFGSHRNTDISRLEMAVTEELVASRQRWTLQLPYKSGKDLTIEKAGADECWSFSTRRMASM